MSTKFYDPRKWDHLTPNDRLATPDAAEYVGISPLTLTRKARSGEVESIKIGRVRQYTVAALDELIARGTRRGA